MAEVSEIFAEKVVVSTFDLCSLKWAIDARGRQWLSVLGINGEELDSEKCG